MNEARQRTDIICYAKQEQDRTIKAKHSEGKHGKAKIKQ